jgi:hypothetical protein
MAAQIPTAAAACKDYETANANKSPVRNKFATDDRPLIEYKRASVIHEQNTLTAIGRIVDVVDADHARTRVVGFHSLIQNFPSPIIARITFPPINRPQAGVEGRA